MNVSYWMLPLRVLQSMAWVIWLPVWVFVYLLSEERKKYVMTISRIQWIYLVALLSMFAYPLVWCFIIGEDWIGGLMVTLMLLLSVHFKNYIQHVEFSLISLNIVDVHDVWRFKKKWKVNRLPYLSESLSVCEFVPWWDNT